MDFEFHCFELSARQSLFAPFAYAVSGSLLTHSSWTFDLVAPNSRGILVECFSSYWSEASFAAADSRLPPLSSRCSSKHCFSSAQTARSIWKPDGMCSRVFPMLNVTTAFRLVALSSDHRCRRRDQSSSSSLQSCHYFWKRNDAWLSSSGFWSLWIQKVIFNPFTPKFKMYILPTFLKRNVYVR